MTSRRPRGRTHPAQPLADEHSGQPDIAWKAAETALAAEHPGEREAAGRSAAPLLASLALNYLPVVDPAVASLIGARRAIDTGTPVPTSD